MIMGDSDNATTRLSNPKQQHTSSIQSNNLRRDTILGALVRRRRQEQRELWNPEADIIREIDRTIVVARSRSFPFEVRITNGSYTVKFAQEENEDENKTAQQFISTVTNSRRLNKIARTLKASLTSRRRSSFQSKIVTKSIVQGINLYLEGGKSYLIVGASGSGKSTLLKMIANLLPRDRNHIVGGNVMVNGVDSRNKEIVWNNVVSYVDQIDKLHGFLTVKETIEFAFQCSYGGTHRGPFTSRESDAENLLKQLDSQGWLVDVILRGVGLKGIEDTFVGNKRVRGVSGGEQKRVTVGEMMATRRFVNCYDEISTGLDAVTTYDVCKLLCSVTRIRSTVTVISLLQPPPETVALFDRIILMDNGCILYAGPVDEVTNHFKDLGYQQPERMDPIDWLLRLPKDGSKFLNESNNFTRMELVEKYRESKRGKEMCEKLETPVSVEIAESLSHDRFKKRYANSICRSIKVVLLRELLLWWRDKYALKARLMQNVIMGLIVGTVFWQTDDPESVLGVVFYSILFVGLGTLARIGPQFETREIFYKEYNANFFPTWTFVLARSLASIPSTVQDSLIFGSLVYWLAGLAPSATSYFCFVMLLLIYAFTSSLMFSVFSARIRDRSTAQAAMAITMGVLSLFSGYTVQPDVIPSYYIWIYWINTLAWILRAAIVNEYQSGFYDEISNAGATDGELILTRFGFTLNGEPFQFVWVWYAVSFCAVMCSVSMIFSTLCLTYIRFTFHEANAVNGDLESHEQRVEQSLTEMGDVGSLALDAKGINLSFRNISYVVKASTTKDELHLLKGITGYFAAGKMTALMGSSGAGKTTLMNVLSLRKTSGEMSGDIFVNGHPQEPDSFRRVTGYVDQFDVQSAQLTVRETVEFSAKMRLPESVPHESKLKFVDKVLATLELDEIAGFLVGDEIDGLSFEQRKRLSIAVELASNPSCIFLDEPTSGLSSRAASIVIRCLRRIADSGITVVATIHQPSVAIFNSFDNLLLLKRGGETVYFGELGYESCSMINYFESYPSTQQIKVGENPATWMLTTIGVGSSTNPDTEMFDYANAYSRSSLAKDCKQIVEQYETERDCKITFSTKFSTCARTQYFEVIMRLGKIYHRSPGYNRVRLFVSAIIAFLFGSVFASQRIPQTESDMVSRVTSIFMTIMFLSVNALNTSLPVFEKERDMYYHHKAAMMYDHKAMILAFTIVEIPFIVLSSMVFCLLWYFTAGFAVNAAKFFFYFLFMTFSMGVFTFFGHCLMSIFRDTQTAQGFGALLIGMSSIFGGILIRPQNIQSFWIWAYWTFPIHYIIEGLLTSQYRNDPTPIAASYGSPFYEYVLSKNCPNIKMDSTPPLECTTGTAEDWIYASFGGIWVPEHIPYNILYLICAIIVAKAATVYGLKKKNFLAK